MANEVVITMSHLSISEHFQKHSFQLSEKRLCVCVCLLVSISFGCFQSQQNWKESSEVTRFRIVAHCHWQGCQKYTDSKGKRETKL